MPIDTTPATRSAAAGAGSGPASPGAGSAGTGTPLAGLRILVVEDDYLLATELCSGLQEAGAKLAGMAGTVEDALELIAKADPDAAVLDVNLGGDGVFPVAEALRRRGKRFVFATGYDATIIRPDFADVPCCHKPVDMRRLVQALKA